MNIKGKVEVYTDYGNKDQKLVCEDNNVIVDGAGEIIVDMLTTTPSLSGIESASAILDTSNYTIQAMTFGKDEEGYKRHAHTDSWSGIDYSFSQGYSGLPAGILGNTGAYLFSGAMVFVSANDNPAGGVSSYFPSGSKYNILPRAPTPTDTRLELGSKTLYADEYVSSLNYYSDPVTWNIPTPSFLSDAHNNGQNMNVLINEDGAGLKPNRDLGFPGIQSIGLLFGAFPRGVQDGGTPGGIFADVSQLTTGVATTDITLGDIGCSATYIGNFNTVSSMDLYGNLGQVYNEYGVVGSGFTFASHPNIYHSGLVVSANVDFSSTGEVIYQTVIGAGDLGFTNFYGGIYNIGLWALDVKESLKTGTPPYSWLPRTNARKYKLFSKKSFTKNLAYIQDSGVNAGMKNYKDLTLIWRLYF